jgi:hypothetical protein
MFRFTIRDVLWLMVVVAAALASFAAAHRKTRWEYKVDFAGPSESVLNATGDEGWEMVAVTVDQHGGTGVYFKRRK